MKTKNILMPERFMYMRTLFLVSIVIFNLSVASGQSDQTDKEVNTSSIHVKTEIDIAVDKGDRDNIIIGWNSSRPGTGEINQGWALSNNGGASFFGNDNSFPHLDGDDVVGDPVVGFNATGNQFMFTMRDNGGVAFTLFDNSAWSNIITVPPLGVNNVIDKIMGIAVDDNLPSPGHNNVYLSGTNFDAADEPSLVFTRLVSGTTTFSAPITLVSDRASQGADVKVGVDNDVFVCWTDYGPTYTLPGGNIGFARSVNNGASFNLVNSTAFGICGIRIATGPIDVFCSTRANDYPSMVIDRSCLPNRGRIYICWADQDDCNASPINKGSVVKMRFSDDDGDSWSNPIVVSKTDHTHSWMPRIAVDDRTGLVTVAYYSFDETHDCDKTNVFVSFSTDGGSNWTHLKVSDDEHKPKKFDNSGYAGDYIGIATHDNRCYVAWHDRRDGDYTVFLSKVDFSLPTRINYAQDFQFTEDLNITGDFELFAKGEITVAPGVNITIAPGSNVHIRSEESIELPPDVMANPTVLMEIGPVDCYDIGTTQARIGKVRDIVIEEDIVSYNIEGYENTEDINNSLKNKEYVQYNIYPNPTKGKITIRSSVTDEKYSYTIFNSVGELVIEGESNGEGVATVTLEYLSKGVYFIKINNENKGKIILSD